MLGRDVVDELHDENGLADAGTAEKTDLSAARVRGDEVDDLDARLEDLGRCLLLVKFRGGTMDRPHLFVADGLGVVVNGLTEDVEDASECRLADRHADRRTRVVRLHAAHQAVGGAHGDAARDAVAEVLHDLDREVDVMVGRLAPDLDGVQNLRQFARRKFNIYDRSNDLYDFTFCQWKTSLPPCTRRTWMSLECLGAADDLVDLVRDARLTYLVVVEVELSDELPGVVGRVAHRIHT